MPERPVSTAFTRSISILDQHDLPLPHLLRDVKAEPAVSEVLSRHAVSGRITVEVLDNPIAGMTCEEAAEALGVVPAVVRAWCLDGTLRAWRYPMRWRIPKTQVRRLSRERGGDVE